ncbi:MAG: T9SS type A sorting domain-containing protein [Acidobacteriota bacterium]
MMKKITFIFLLLLSSNIYPYKAVLYDGSRAQAWEKLIAKTLSGIVNRDSSRLYLLNVYETWCYSGTDEKWAEIYSSKGNVTFDTLKSVQALIDRFRPFIKGGISYDQNQYYSNFQYQNIQWQGEYAALLGGLTDRLPVTTSQAQAFNLTLNDSVLVKDSFDNDPDVYVTGRLENAVNSWNNPVLSDEQKYLNIVLWGIKNLLPRCNPSKLYIREITDYAVQKKMFQVNLAGTDPYSAKFETLPDKRAEILEQVLNYLHSKNPQTIFHIYGWMTPEPVVQWFAFFGASFHETLLSNLSWHSSFHVAQAEYKRASIVNPDTLRLSDKYYLLFIGTEGDAGNWNFGFQSGAWLSKDRGKVPIGWGWNLELMNECPFVASYYSETATANDGFISVTSPLGYAYPDLFPQEVWKNAADSATYLMNKFNVNNIYAYKHYANGAYTYSYRGKMLDNSFDFNRLGEFQKALNAGLTFIFDPKLSTQTPYLNYGGLLFNHSDDGTFYGDVSNPGTAASRILNSLKTKTKPYFMLSGYQRLRQDDFTNRTDPENADLSIGKLLQLVNLLKSDPAIGSDIEVVTPEKFSALLRKKLGLSGMDLGDTKTKGYALFQNYPNPFNPTTIITFEIPDESMVELKVFDVLGKEVSTLVRENKPAGRYSVNFDASRLSAGIYVCRLRAGQYTFSRKMSLIK